MILDMLEITGTPILSGADNGVAAFAALLCQIKMDPDDPTLIFVDFKDIEFASGSFLRESVFEFKKYVRSSYPSLYPVVVNISNDIAEDLLLLAKARSDVLMSCTLDDENNPEAPVLIGSLEPKQSMTLELVETLGVTDAKSLMSNHGESEGNLSANAWNNRLAALAGRGLIREYSIGRAKSYRPLLTGDG